MSIEDNEKTQISSAMQKPINKKSKVTRRWFLTTNKSELWELSSEFIEMYVLKAKFITEEQT